MHFDINLFNSLSHIIENEARSASDVLDAQCKSDCSGYKPGSWDHSLCMFTCITNRRSFRDTPDNGPVVDSLFSASTPGKIIYNYLGMGIIVIFRAVNSRLF
jgi:hypothetical protein